MNNPSAYEASGWITEAACGGYGSASMFPSDGDTQGINDAKGLCATCGVSLECLEAAIRRGEQFGIWGGMTPDERKSFRRKLQRSRLVDTTTGKPITDHELPG